MYWSESAMSSGCKHCNARKIRILRQQIGDYVLITLNYELFLRTAGINDFDSESNVFFIFNIILNVPNVIMPNNNAEKYNLDLKYETANNDFSS